MSNNAVLFVLVVQIFLVHSANGAGCDVNPFAEQSPLLIENGKSSIIYPQYGARNVTFKSRQVVELACPQKKVVLNGQPTGSIVAATCSSNNMFRIQGGTYSWDQIKCSGDPLSETRITNGKCGNNDTLAEIGFDLDGRRFLQTMQICFHMKLNITLYSYFHLEYTTDISDNSSRPSFRGDKEFYSLTDNKLNDLYKINVQRMTINQLLKLDDLNSTKYIQDVSGNYLAKGHLSARADFYYPALIESTFRYINAAPQWQKLNGGIWAKIEKSTRNYASLHKVDLQIWTGTYGIATLPSDEDGKEKELYLYANGDIRAIPVPALFWKIVYNPSTTTGIVFIGINNPYLNDVTLEKYVICRNVSYMVTWIQCNNNAYACEVEDFREVVKYAPNLTVSGPLI